MKLKKILIVDNDPASLVNLSAMVEKAGFTPVGFQKPTLAMEFIEKPDNHDIRMIIAEMNIPGSDGFTFLKAIQKKPQLKLMPFLFLSELQDTAVLVNAYEQGAVDYFIKPIRKESLFIAKIKSMVDAFERTLQSANTLLSGQLSDKPLVELLAVCENESLNGFLRIKHADGIGVITFVKGLPEKMAIVDAQQKIIKSESEAFEAMSDWSEGEFLIRRGNL
ncbi:MAG TPA: response regulator [bacterium]|nr:response regulator [bacterium]